MKIHLISEQKSHKVIQKVYPGSIFLIEENIFHEEIFKLILNLVVRKRLAQPMAFHTNLSFVFFSFNDSLSMQIEV